MEEGICIPTMESEFVSMIGMVKEFIWYDRILKKCIDRKFFTEPKLNSELHVDNLATLLIL